MISSLYLAVRFCSVLQLHLGILVTFVGKSKVRTFGTSEEIDLYVVMRRDSKAKEILGITITNFAKYFETKKTAKHKSACLELSFFIRSVASQDSPSFKPLINV